MIYDYLIIGQGLAGSLLAYELTENQQSVLIINDIHTPSSSMVAGGMYNPVTGKYLAKTWLAEEIFPVMMEFYSDIEKRFSCELIHATQIFRPYSNEQHKTNFLNAIEKFGLHDYVTHQEQNPEYEKSIRNPFGGLITHNSGWIDVPELIRVLRQHFEEQQLIRDFPFDHNLLEISDELITYEGIQARNIIFCEGFHVKNNPLFNWLPFNPVKGETLLARIPDYHIPEIVNQGKWILPVKDSLFRIGATYNWHHLNFEPTEDGREYLLSQVGKFLKSEFEIIDQQAGVRPATTDRRPIMGPHPRFPNVHIFNGLGTKGVSLAPYFAKNMTDFLTVKKEIHPETTIERFYALY
ncbi:FAD-dependent oxidoreductase [Emticicia sp. CRIBPO]|uniref:NAD(P)/FAD-dependent oxidoreductase n=1 Tax=Emticicia sp. CRIBPO TaxID=2683258 RepID=UPI001411CD05|nr:FAD-dependent oxidoreductase [Emticicia sp. CRIBPO]NBA86571.1 FAD-dependent oxidoreductase [Emticicia sp. CRIBPO]